MGLLLTGSPYRAPPSNEMPFAIASPLPHHVGAQRAGRVTIKRLQKRTTGYLWLPKERKGEAVAVCFCMVRSTFHFPHPRLAPSHACPPITLLL